LYNAHRIYVYVIAVSKSHAFFWKFVDFLHFFDDDAYTFTSTRRIFSTTPDTNSQASNFSCDPDYAIRPLMITVQETPYNGLSATLLDHILRHLGISTRIILVSVLLLAVTAAHLVVIEIAQSRIYSAVYLFLWNNTVT